MIIMHPMIVSNTVSSNIIPGICKSLEKFLLAYRMDYISSRWTGKSFRLKESNVPEGEIWFENIMEQRVGGPPTGASSSTVHNKATANALNQQVAQLNMTQDLQGGQDGKKSSSSLGFDLKQLNSDILSVEPTFVTIEVEVSGAKLQQVVGIKVVPYAVSSDAGLAQLITSDSVVSTLNSHLISKGREIQRAFWKVWQAAIRPIPIVGEPKSAIGDPRHDILMARSKYGKHILVCMNYMDLQTEFFRENGPRKIDKLHRMGWDSLIFPDDVQKRVYYCMKEFKGVCSVVPYSMVYSSVGKMSYGAYDSLEDVRKTTSPFFRMKKISSSKLVNEMISLDEVIDGYLGSLDNKIPLTEGLDQFMNAISSMNVSSQLNKLKDVLTNKNYDKLKSLRNMLPKTSIEEVKKVASEKFKDFDRLYLKAKRVYTNSVSMKLNNNQIAIDLMSIMTAARASLSEKPDMAFTEIVKKSTYEIDDNVDPMVTPASTDVDLTLGGIVFSVIAMIAISGFVGAFMTFNSYIMIGITMACLAVLMYRLGGTAK